MVELLRDVGRRPPDIDVPSFSATVNAGIWFLAGPAFAGRGKQTTG